jgi:inosine/xanthosine triphosphate pyrophosphatase family protein
MIIHFFFFGETGMNPRHRILLGTSNPGKIAEMTALFDGLSLMLLQPSDLSLQLQVEETAKAIWIMQSTRH